MLWAGLGCSRGAALPSVVPEPLRGRARKPQTRPGSCSGGIAISHGASCKSTEDNPAADAPPLKNPWVKERNGERAGDGAGSSQKVLAGGGGGIEKRSRSKEQL